MVCACIVMFILAILYEGLKVLRETLLKSHSCLDNNPKNRPEYSPPTMMTSSSSNDQVLVANQNSRFVKFFCYLLKMSFSVYINIV